MTTSRTQRRISVLDGFELADIEAQAAQLATAHDLDEQRVQETLERIAERRFEHDDSEKCPYDLRWRPSLRDLDLEKALHHLAPEEALSLFEPEHLNRTARRVLFVSYLNHPDTPLYSLHELAELAEMLADHLKKNRDALVETGFLDRPFRHSRWLSDRLGQMYYIRCPIGVDPSATGRDEPGYVFAVPTDRSWEEIPGRARQIRCIVPLVAYLHGNRVYLETEVYKVVACEDAPDLRDLAQAGELELTAGDLHNLVSKRGKLLDTKIRILDLLASAARRRSAERLWEDCLEVLTSALDAEDVESMLRVDEVYTGYNFIKGSVCGEDAFTTLPPGGIADMLATIGHYEKELTIGTYAQVHSRLKDIVGPDLSCLRRLTVANYYEAIGIGKASAVKDAYNCFRSLEKEEMGFWTDYRDRVNDAVQGEFRVKFVPPSMPIRRRDLPKVQLKWDSICQAIESNLDSMGNCPDITTTLVTHKGIREADHIFRQVGEKWQVRFDGVTYFLNDRIGMRYLRSLLAKPYEPIGLHDLLRMGCPSFESIRDEAVERITPDEFVEEGLSAHQLGRTLVDKDDYGTVGNLRGWKRALEKQLDDARLAGNFEEVESCEADLRAAKRAISAIVDRHGNLRSETDSRKIIRDALSKGIRDALSAMEKLHPSLYRHLKEHVTLRGGEYTYVPGQPTEWDTGA